MEENNLPNGWKMLELGDVLSYEQPTKYIVNSTAYDKKYKTPVLTAGKSFIIGYTNETQNIYTDLPVIIFDDFTTSSQFVNFPFKVKSSAMKILQANKDRANIKYLFYLMQILECSHDTHKRYWISIYAKQKVALPPLPIQEQIVAKIEELFSELDKGVDELQKIKAQLKVYRQAVLKDAFEGKLTESWRNGSLKIETINDIVDDIRIGPFGTMLHEYDYIDNGIPVINPKHIKNQSISPNYNVTISKQKALELQSYLLRENDVILGRRGEMGRSAFVSKKEIGWICGTGSMILRLKNGYNPKLYSLILSSQNVVHYLEEHAIGTTMKNLNEKIVKNIPIPNFQLLEQDILINKIESRLSVCDKIEQIVDESLQKSESLRQSILKKAFEGKLI
jgi:type I restriction enzyme S subunit